MTQHARRLLIASLVTLGTVALTACQPPVPDPQPLPELVWESEGTSPLEDDEFVVAARAADTARTLAWNRADFALEQFIATNTSLAAQRLYNGYRTSFAVNGLPPTAYPGPGLWQPISVTPDAEGGAEVVVCNASEGWIFEDGGEPTYDLAQGLELIVFIVDDDGTLRADEFRRTGVACDATGAPVGRFDPAPQLRDSITEDQVVPPPG